MRTHAGVIVLITALMFGPRSTTAQVRKDIFDPMFTTADRTLLYDLMEQYIDGPVLEDHCAEWTITGMMIHSDFDFLPFHRTYIEAMEDFLIAQGHPEFVPLPYWNPAVAAPTEFENGGIDGDGLDPDCGSATLCDPFHPPSDCVPVANWDPQNDRFTLAPHITLPIVPGNDLCDWIINPNFPDPNGNCCPSGLSRMIEGPNPQGNYHNNTHIWMGGVMLSFRSPAAPIFWLWHAYVDDIWKEWDMNCPNSTMQPIDLYMKDTPMVVESERDRGEEPNIDGGPMWVSTDIWVRRQNDGILNQETENPDYFTTPGLTNYVYVRVRNRGSTPSLGTEQLTLNWAKAATALSWPSYWDGSITSPALMGDQIDVAHTLPVIQPGSSHIEVFQWNAPDPAIYAAIGTDPIFWANEPWHFCLLARVETAPGPGFGMTSMETTDLYANVRNNNNIVWKNISVVDIAGMVEGGGWPDDKIIGASVMAGDAWGIGGTFNLVFKNPDRYRGNPVTEEAEVRITLDQPLWEAWQNAGAQAENMQVSREDRCQLIITGDPARLKTIPFDPNERFLAHVSFNFLAEKLSGQSTFDYDMIQEKTDGQAVGGERYHIIVPGRPGFYANAGGDQHVSPSTSVDLNAYTIGEAAIYNWYDPDGNLIQTGTSLTVSPEISTKYKLEVIAEADGVKDYDEVEVKINDHEITAIAPNPSTGNTQVNYRLTNATSAYLVLTMPYSGVNNQYILNVTGDQTTLNVDDLPPGTYTLILMVNGQPADAGTLTVL